MVVIQLLHPLAVTALIFAVALGLGRLLLRRWEGRFQSRLEFHCLALGLGLGLLSHATLALGLIGGWRTAGFAAVGLVALGGAVAGFRPFPGRRSPEQSTSHLTPLATTLLALLALVLACQTLWALPPVANYDVLEYHLGAVRHWLREGRMFPIRHLFYSALPFEVEMWYALGCFGEGNPLVPFSVKLINAGLLIGIVCTTCALAQAHCRRRELQWLACLLFAVHPLTLSVVFDGLADLGPTLYCALALLTWLRWHATRDRLFFVLFSVFLGLSVCCKYTVAGLLVFPVLAILVPVSVLTRPEKRDGAEATGNVWCWKGWRSLTQLTRLWVCAGAIVAAVFLPWAVKGVVQYGNPVYPLLSNVFPSKTWSPEQTEYYLQAHGRANPLHSAYWAALAGNARRMGGWLMAMVILGAIAAARQRNFAVIALSLVVAAGMLVHCFLPGNPTRFLLPLVPVAVVLAARAAEDALRRSARWCVALVAPAALGLVVGILAFFDPAWVLEATKHQPTVSFERFVFPVFAKAGPSIAYCRYLSSSRPRLLDLAGGLGAVANSQYFVNENTPRDARIFLLYEARIGCFDRPVEVGSAFDRSPLVERAAGARTAEELLARLSREGFDYLYVNETEMVRIVRFYGPQSLYEERKARMGEPTAENAGLWMDLYPPFYQDPRFTEGREVIEAFLDLCRRRAVLDQPQYGVWIAPLN